MAEENAKGRLLKKYERMVKKQDEIPEDKFQEIEHELSEDTSEVSEGLDIEKEEEAGEEAYPEIKRALRDDDEEDED